MPKPEEKKWRMPPHQCVVHLKFVLNDGDKVTDVTLDSVMGYEAEIKGTLFPSELEIVTRIVQVLKDYKDRFNPRRLQPLDQAIENVRKVF